MKYRICIILLLCSCEKVYSPNIYITNFSNQDIKDFTYYVNGERLNYLPLIKARESKVVNLELTEVNDFFGLVMLYWHSSDGLPQMATFRLSKNKLPSYKGNDSLGGNTPPSVSIYVGQSDYVAISSDMIDSLNFSKKLEQLLRLLQ